MCLNADVPLIESGSAGYLGQVTVIKKVAGNRTTYKTCATQCESIWKNRILKKCKLKTGFYVRSICLLYLLYKCEMHSNSN